jgi:hypothetical protein
VPDWLADYAALCAADRERGLPPEDLEHIAVASFLLGRDADVVPLRERALQLTGDGAKSSGPCGVASGASGPSAVHAAAQGPFAPAGALPSEVSRDCLPRTRPRRPQQPFRGVGETRPSAVQFGQTTALGLGLSMLAAALGGSLGAKLWPGYGGRDAHNR